MSYRCKRAKSLQAAKAKQTTVNSVNDILSQVIRDVTNEEDEGHDPLLSSTFDHEDQGVNGLTQLTQAATAEAGDAGSSWSARHFLSRSSTQQLATDHPRQLRSKSRSNGIPDNSFQQVNGVGDGVLEDPEPNLYDIHEDEDPPITDPTETTTLEPNNARASQRNTSGRQNLSPPTIQGLPADSPTQVRASKRSSTWIQEVGEPVQQLQADDLADSSQWSDDVEFDDMEEVEMRDLNGKRGRKRGKILPRHVWSLQPGVRFVVPFNALDQPIRKGGNVLIRFLGDVAKNGELCPIGEGNWFKVDKSFKADIITLVREKFVLPPREEINKNLLQHVSSKWRVYKHKLKAQYKKPDRTQEQVASIVPNGVIPSQWVKLVEYWFSDKSQYLSAKGKEARATQVHSHTTGSKSFATKRDEFEKVHGREPGAVEWFDQTHKRKDGTYVDKTSKEFLDTAAAMIAQRGAASSSSQRISIENQVFKELMYSDEDQRPLGYGFGVDRTKVFGIGRKREYLATGTLAESEGATRNKRPRVKVESTRSSYLSSDLSGEVERLNFTVEAMSETNEVMQTQLQMQSKHLKRQSKQLKMQSQQMEGLQLQLQQVSSLLTKFGLMLNKSPSNSIRGGLPYRGLQFLNPRQQKVTEAVCEFSDAESESSDWDSDY